MPNLIPWPQASVAQNYARPVNYSMIGMEDPRHERYLKICYVCTEEAKPGQEHLRNYGGIVCYSCRAFWRRSHQKTRNPNFACKKGGNCVITIKTRRRCQKCRYNRCLQTGMNPDAVLDDDQKKIRFRKLLLKRQKLLGSTQAGSAELQDDDSDQENGDADMLDGENSSEESQIASSDVPEHFVRDQNSPSPTDLTEPGPQLHHPHHHHHHHHHHHPQETSAQTPTEEAGEPGEGLTDRIRTLVHNYQSAVALTKSARADLIVSKLNVLRSGQDDLGLDLTREDILYLIDSMSDIFRNFALIQR